MCLLPRLIFLLVLELLPAETWGQSPLLQLPLLANSLDLLPYATEWADSTGKANFDSVRTKTFGPLSSALIGTVPRWWKVEVQNASGQPIPDVLLMAPAARGWIFMKPLPTLPLSPPGT